MELKSRIDTDDMMKFLDCEELGHNWLTKSRTPSVYKGITEVVSECPDCKARKTEFIDNE